MFQLIKSTDIVEITSLKVLLYGEPGAGKTSLAFTAKNPILFDFDEGAQRSAYRKNIIKIKSWGDIAENYAEFLKVVKEYDTIIIDTVGTALEFLGEYIKVKNPKLATNKLQWYGKLKDEFKEFLNGLKVLGKDIIMIAHVKEKDEGDVKIKRPAISGGTYDNVMQLTDFCGYVYMKDNNRTINFSPTDYSHGKNSANIPITAIPDFKDVPNYMSILLEKMKNSLVELSEEQKNAVEKISSVNAVIDDLQTAEELNDYMEMLKSEPKAMKLQFFNRMKKQAENLGIEFDKKTNQFTAKPVPVVETEKESDGTLCFE